MKSRLRLVSDEQLRHLLTGCAFATGGQRPGFVLFSTRHAAARLVREGDVDVHAAMRLLRQLAQQRGGEFVEGEVLWLPEREFEELWATR